MKNISLISITACILWICACTNIQPESKSLATDAAGLKEIIAERDYSLLYFWTTWCGPCKKTIRETLPKLEKSIDTSKVQLVLVAVSKDGKKIEQIFEGVDLRSKKVKLQFAGPDIFLNHKYALESSLGEMFPQSQVWQNSVPVFVLVDRTGKVINADLPKKLEEVLGALESVGDKSLLASSSAF